MNVIKGKAQLNKPIHDLCFRKLLILTLLFLNMECQVSMLTIFHDNNQDSFLNKRMFIGHDIWMIEFSQQLSL